VTSVRLEAIEIRLANSSAGVSHQENRASGESWGCYIARCLEQLGLSAAGQVHPDGGKRRSDRRSDHETQTD
jgi:hypothetical protein